MTSIVVKIHIHFQEDIFINKIVIYNTAVRKVWEEKIERQTLQYTGNFSFLKQGLYIFEIESLDKKDSF